MSDMFFSGLITGIGVGVILAMVVVAVIVPAMLKRRQALITSQALAQSGKKLVPVLLALLAGALLFGVPGVMAQTPVPLTIPTNDIFTAANNWIATFAPIASIGIGISIALAVLGYLGTMIVKAFHA